jgi:hypothetical protein
LSLTAFTGKMSNEISFNTNLSDQVKTRDDFTYKITPTMISITDTGLGQRSVAEDIEAILHKIEHWHQLSISSLKIMCRDGKGFWHGIQWDGKNVSLSHLDETDEQKARKKLLALYYYGDVPLQAAEASYQIPSSIQLLRYVTVFPNSCT